MLWPWALTAYFVVGLFTAGIAKINDNSVILANPPRALAITLLWPAVWVAMLRSGKKRFYITKGGKTIYEKKWGE